MAAIDPTALRAFPLFNELPETIRLRIWEAALPGPRVVEIVQKPLKKNVGDWERDFGTVNTEDEFTGAGLLQCLDFGGMVWKGRYNSPQEYTNFNATMNLVGVTSPCIPPQILFVCKEAYAVAAKHYQRAFSSLGSFPETYFDFENDTLYINEGDFLSQQQCGNIPDDIASYRIWALQEAGGLEQVKNLAVLLDWDEGLNDNSLEEWIVYLLRHFRGLKKLILVFEHYIREEDDNSILRIENPIEVDEYLDLYNCYDPQSGEEFKLPIEGYHPYEQEVRQNVLQEINVRELGKVEPHLQWKMPDIKYSIILTDTYWHELKETQEAIVRKDIEFMVLRDKMDTAEI